MPVIFRIISGAFLMVRHPFNQRTNEKSKDLQKSSLDINIKSLRSSSLSFLRYLYVRSLLGKKEYFSFFIQKSFRTHISMDYVFPTVFSKDFVFGFQATAFLQLEVLPTSPSGSDASL